MSQCHLCHQWVKYLVAWLEWRVCLPCYQTQEDKDEVS